MLTINWDKIDKFYLVFLLVMVGLSVMVIFTFKTVFSSIIASNESGQVDLSSELKVDKDKLDEAYSFAFEKEIIKLEINE